MGSASKLAPWASDIRERNGKLVIALRRGLDLNGLLNLLRTQDVSNVVSLRVPGSVGLSGLRAVVSGKQFTGLHSLALHGFPDADDAVDVVFEAESMSGLRTLKVWGVSDAVDNRLARGEVVNRLSQIDIRNSHELTSLDRYFDSKRAASLRFLTVNRTGLNDASLLFLNGAVTELRSISLAACDFDSETVDKLVDCPHLTKLRKLNLSHNTQDDVISSLYRLLQAKKLPTLETLTLCGCELEGINWNRVSFPQLRKLDVRENPLSFDELQEILQCSGLPNLEQLVASTPDEFVPSDIDRRLTLDDRIPPWA